MCKRSTAIYGRASLPRLSDVFGVGRHFAEVPNPEVDELDSITSFARASSDGAAIVADARAGVTKAIDGIIVRLRRHDCGRTPRRVPDVSAGAGQPLASRLGRCPWME
jgi:hypothetical protein